MRGLAEAANRTKDEFLAMLGHELRNPLAPILTALQLMSLRGDASVMKERTVIDRQVDTWCGSSTICSTCRGSRAARSSCAGSRSSLADDRRLGGRDRPVRCSKSGGTMLERRRPARPARARRRRRA